MSNFNIDLDRRDRLGFPEVVYGASKSIEVLGEILQYYQEKGERPLITKLQAQKAEALQRKFPNAFYDRISGIFMLERNLKELVKADVAIVSAGSADQFVVNEAFFTLEHLGYQASRIQDIGVAGLHRLLGKLEELQKFKVLIVIAGFEGALPTVMGGLLAQPIIAVPTSVGYGVAAGGRAALQSMLSSCANGISVVNIDNGYGAAMAALRIVNMNLKWQNH